MTLRILDCGREFRGRVPFNVQRSTNRNRGARRRVYKELVPPKVGVSPVEQHHFGEMGERGTTTSQNKDEKEKEKGETDTS